MGEKKIVYIDMDGVICDYNKHADELHIDRDKATRVKNFYIELEPIEGAIDSILKLMKKYDVYVLSTASWTNTESWKEKIDWIKKYIPELKKRVILTHSKYLLNGDYLIDDRPFSNNTNLFKGKILQFSSDEYPDWKSILDYLMI